MAHQYDTEIVHRYPRWPTPARWLGEQKRGVCIIDTQICGVCTRNCLINKHITLQTTTN